MLDNYNIMTAKTSTSEVVQKVPTDEKDHIVSYSHSIFSRKHC